MADKKWDVYVYGDVNIDLVIPNVDKFPLAGQEDVVDIMDTFVGGGAAVFTLGIGKLGLKPVFQGTIGNDCYGDFIRKEFRAQNIDDSLLVTSQDNKTGISISFTNEKDRSFLTYRGTNDEIEISKIALDQVTKARHIHLTSYMGRKNHQAYLKILKKIKQTGDITVSFDVGWDDSGEWYKGIYDLFPYIDLLFMNETEAVHYSGLATAEEAIVDFGKTCPLVVAKLGKDGSIAWSNDQQYEAKAYPVKAIDTTGAGDSFNAGFVYGFLKGKSVEACLSYANGCGALSVTALGGNTGFPVEKQLNQFIEEAERVGKR